MLRAVYIAEDVSLSMLSIRSAKKAGVMGRGATSIDLTGIPCNRPQSSAISLQAHASPAASNTRGRILVALFFLQNQEMQIHDVRRFCSISHDSFSSLGIQIRLHDVLPKGMD